MKLTIANMQAGQSIVQEAVQAIKQGLRNPEQKIQVHRNKDKNVQQVS